MAETYCPEGWKRANATGCTETAIGPASESGVEPGPSTEDEGEKSVEPTGSVVSPTANGEDLPDWLKSMIPGDPVIETLKETQPTVESHPAEEDDVPDWLKSITPTEAAGEDFNAPRNCQKSTLPAERMSQISSDRRPQQM